MSRERKRITFFNKEHLRSSSRSGFTLIEMFMVIIICAALAAISLTQFVDFGRDAKATALQRTLASYRTAINFQTQQIKLRCKSTAVIWGDAMYTSFLYNDVTEFEAVAPIKLCSKSELPIADERRFLDISTGSEVAHQWNSDVDIGAQGYKVAANPFAVIADGIHHVQHLRTVNLGSPATPDQICNVIDIDSSSLGRRYHWVFDIVTSKLYAGTNTPGIRECAF